MSLYLTETVCTPNSLGTKCTAYRPSLTSLISASSVTPPGDVTVALKSNDVIPARMFFLYKNKTPVLLNLGYLFVSRFCVLFF